MMNQGMYGLIWCLISASWMVQRCPELFGGLVSKSVGWQMGLVRLKRSDPVQGRDSAAVPP